MAHSPCQILSVHARIAQTRFWMPCTTCSHSAYARMGTEDVSGCLPSFKEACPGRGAHARCSVCMPMGPLLRRAELKAGRGAGRRSMVRLRLRLYVGDKALSRRCSRALRRILPTTTRGCAQCLHMYHQHLRALPTALVASCARQAPALLWGQTGTLLHLMLRGIDARVKLRECSGQGTLGTGWG